MGSSYFRSALAVASLFLACTPTPASDDEAGGTTTTESSGTAAESGTTTTGSTDTRGGTDTTGGFVDGFDIPLLDECDVWSQDCPEGYKCVPYSNDGWSPWNDHKCVEIMGDQAPGEPCTWGGMVAATDDCDATSICFDVERVDGLLVGTCFAQCTGSAEQPMCGPGSSCLITDGSLLAVCVSYCDPLAQDCGPGLGCYWVDGEFGCALTVQELPPGEPCEAINECAAGSSCVDAANLPSCNGAACCTAYCDLARDDAGCVAQPGTVCTPFYAEGMAPPGYENVGVCILPP